MSTEANKAILRRIPDEALNGGDLTCLDEIISADFVTHSAPPGLAEQGPEAIRQLVGMIRTAFPDVHYALEHEVCEGDVVVHHATAQGTHRGPLMGIPPTGKRVTWTEMHIVRMHDGKCVEHWGEVDMLGMLQQLGVVPMPKAA